MNGPARHIFQLSMVLLVPLGFTFLATADSKQPLAVTRQVAIPPAAAVVLAFGTLYYLEHVYLPAHGSERRRGYDV